MVLPDQVGENLRAVAEGERAMGHGFRSLCSTRETWARATSGTPEGLLTAATFRS